MRTDRVSAVAAALVAAVALSAPPQAASAASPRRVTARLELDQRRVPVGKPVKGHLVLHNPRAATVDLNRGCTPKWTVVLGSGRHAPDVAFSLECGTRAFLVKPGTTRLRFAVSTNGPPKLRTGRYHAFLVASDPSFPHASPVAVRIVARR